MKIGIDVSRANKAQKTGVEWYAYFLIQEMKRLAGEYHLDDVVLYSDEALTGDLADLPDGWESRVLRWPPKRLWTQLRLSIEMLIHSPDVLFIPAHVPPAILPKQTVMTIHDVAAARFPESYNWFERWYSVYTAKRAMRKLSQVIVPSTFTKKELLDITTTHHADIHVVHHGYHVDSGKTIQLDKHGIKKPYLLFVGRIEEKKNTARLVEAYTMLREQGYNYQLVLVGKHGHGHERVLAAIETSPYKDDIIRPGWLSQDELASLYAQASLFVFPSLYEGFGIPVLEAFASKTPVVTAIGSCLQEVAGDAAIYADPLSVKSIATHIAQVLDDSELQKQLIASGEKRLQQFSWEKAARETIMVLMKHEKEI